MITNDIERKEINRVTGRRRRKKKNRRKRQESLPATDILTKEESGKIETWRIT